MSLSEQVKRRSLFKAAVGVFLSSGILLSSKKSAAASHLESGSTFKMSSLAELREQGNATHQIVEVDSFSTENQSEYSGGIFKLIESNESLKDDGGITIKTDKGFFFRRQFDNSKKSISALWFGCLGDGIYDNTNASQALLDYCTLNGYEAVYPKGDFFHKASITKKESQQCPSISGAGCGPGRKSGGYSNLIFAPGASLIIKGGSGVLSGAQISDLIFTGTNPSSDCPLIIADQCGVRVKNCAFSNAAVGSKLVNHDKGGFTEFVVFEECFFKHSCNTAIEYIRLDGNDSFHGSGLWNCIIQGGSLKDSSEVIIGKGCLLYNAPMQFSVFKKKSSPIIFHNGSTKSNVFGNITVEKRKNIVELVGPSIPLIILGNLACLTENLRTTFAFFCERVQCNSDGSLNFQRKPYSLKQILPAGGGDIIKFSNGESAFIAISILSSNYSFKYLLTVNIDNDRGEGYVGVITKYQSTDSPEEYGAPEFEIKNSRLYVLNHNYPNELVSVFFTVTFLDTRNQFKML
jgi:hypothetical protein